MPFFIELASVNLVPSLIYYKKVRLDIVGHLTVQIDFATSLFFGIFNWNRQLLFYLCPASAHQEIHFRDTGETEGSTVFDICMYFKEIHFFQKMIP